MHAGASGISIYVWAISCWLCWRVLGCQSTGIYLPAYLTSPSPWEDAFFSLTNFHTQFEVLACVVYLKSVIHAQHILPLICSHFSWSIHNILIHSLFSSTKARSTEERKNASRTDPICRKRQFAVRSHTFFQICIAHINILIHFIYSYSEDVAVDDEPQLRSTVHSCAGTVASWQKSVFVITIGNGHFEVLQECVPSLPIPCNCNYVWYPEAVAEISAHTSPIIPTDCIHL